MYCRDFAFGINFVSTDVRIEREVAIYPLLSFVSELGGSLGLFLILQICSVYPFVNEGKGTAWSYNSLYLISNRTWAQAKKHDTFYFENEAQNGYVRWNPEFGTNVFHRMY